MQNSSQDDDSWAESDSRFDSEFEEISASTGGHSSLHESGQISDPDDEDIFSYEEEIVSEGDINSSRESIYYESSHESSYISSTAEISLSAREQQEGQQQLYIESDSSSSASVDFDSSSSSGSLPISSPQHQLADQVSEEERDPDISNRQESGSEKLKRILYGPTSSISDDDLLSSSSDSSTSSTYGRFEDDDIIPRGTNNASSIGGANFGNITTGNEHENNTIDVHGGNINVTVPGNEERFGLPISVSPKSLDIYHDESFDYEESFSVLEQIDEEDEEDDDDDDEADDDDVGVGGNEIERNNAISSASNSDTNSKSHKENDRGKDASSRSDDETITEADSKGDDHENDSPKNIEQEFPGQSPVVGIERKDSIAENENETETEPKSSTIWVASDGGEDAKNESHESSSDEVGWKPPALNTFSPTSYEKRPQAYEKEKFPKARHTSERPKQIELSSNVTEAETMKEKIQASKTRSTPPVPVIDVNPFDDDDSTLGTVGTYLERMPELRNYKTKQKKSEQEKERSTAFEFISNTVRAKDPVNDNFGNNVTGNSTAFGAQRQKETFENISEFKDSFEDDLPISTDPPGDSYLFQYDQYDEYQPLLLPPKTTPRESIHQIDKTWKSSEPSSSIGHSILTHQTTSQYVISSSSPMSPWVPTGIQDIGEEVDKDPTRAFINTIISEKRSMVPKKSRVTEIGPESEDNLSQSSSKDFSEPEEMPPSEASSSQSYEINVLFGGSSSSINKRRKSTVSKSTSDSKTTNSSKIAEGAKRLPQRRGSVSQLMEPKDIESGSNHSDHSRSSSSSSEASKEVGSKRGRNVLQRRGSALKLQRRGSVSNLQRRGSVSMLQRRGSMSRLFRRRSKGSESSDRGGMDQVIRMLQRRGSMSRLVQYWSRNDDESASSSSSSELAKEPVDQQLKRMPQRRGSVNQLIQHGTNIDDESSSSSSSSQSSKKEKGVDLVKRMPQRRGSVSRLIQYGSSNSENSGSSTSAKAKGSRLQQDLEMRNRKTTMILLWSTLILIVASIIVIVVLWQRGMPPKPNDNGSKDPSSLPTLMPTLSQMPSADDPSDVPSSAPINLDLLSLITESYPQSQQALEDPTSPQSKALKWLESPTNSEILEDRRLLQRFALATLYYSTNGGDWTNNAGWLSEEDECNWMSKSKESICSDLGEYIILDLQENNLNGTLPIELGILSDTIRTVITRENSLSGEIPSSILSDLKGLQVLDLSSNGFSGVLVQELFNATNLTRLSLFENRITSSIPTEIGRLKNLTVLDLGSNELSSTIPSTISELTKLAGLSLFDNKLTGTIPAELSGIQTLQMLYIDSNNLEAPVPSEVCALRIEEFWADCEKIQCTCCSTCCASNFGCFDV